MSNSETPAPTSRPATAKKRLFPMHLTPFENYMFVDDRPRYPMTFVVEFEFSGKLLREAFERAIDDALERHPLLRAIIRAAKQNKDCWVDGKGLKPKIDWGEIDDPIEFEDSEFIDLRNEVGLRIWVRRNEQRAVMTAQFHHSVCDGIGSYQFLGDVLWSYARRTGDESLDELPPLDPMALRKRLSATFNPDNFLDNNGKVRAEWGEMLRMIWGRMDALKQNRSASQVGPQPFPGIKSCCMDKDEYREIRLAAQELGQTPNDYMLEKLFLAMKEWNRHHRWIPWPQVLGVMLPLDLREQGIQFPAANIVTYSFVRRRGRKLNDRELLVKSLREEISALKRDRQYTTFMNMIVGGHFYPKALKRIVGPERCLATAILSNTGDPTKQFYAQLPREKSVIRCGNLMLEEVSGVPPLRPKTHATLSIFTYRRQLKICVRCDPHYFSTDDTQQFLDTYMNTIRDGMKN